MSSIIYMGEGFNQTIWWSIDFLKIFRHDLDYKFDLLL